MFSTLNARQVMPGVGRFIVGGVMGSWGRIGVVHAIEEAQIGQLTNIESIQAVMEDSNRVDLGLAWHGLHFLFTGSACGGDEPLCYLMKGGQQFGSEDDPVRLLQPIDVELFTVAPSKLSLSDLQSRYDPTAMDKADIYPGDWAKMDRDEALEILAEAFEALRSLVGLAARQRKGILISVLVAFEGY